MTNKIDFIENGFVGPFALELDESVIDAAIEKLKWVCEEKPSHPLYNRYSVRDWHLLDDSVLSLFKDPGLIKILNDILGEDLILWRSKIFNKQPFEGSIDWHQEWGAFNGEEIGNDVPALRPTSSNDLWDLTVWIALDDIDTEMAPLQFAKGTHRKRFPIKMVNLVDSGFFTSSLENLSGAAELIQKSRENSLIIDIDTSQIFRDNFNSNGSQYTYDEAKSMVLNHIKDLKGALTLDFDRTEYEIVGPNVKKGQYWIFSERVMHGSGINTSNKNRLAVNGRIARSDTLVYPGRLNGNSIDGSNIDITKHRCVLLSGENKIKENIF